jgi:hypothetical protein
MVFFSFPHRLQPSSKAHPASCPSGTGSSFSGVKRPGRKADESPPSSAEVNACNCFSAPQYAFTEWHLVKHRANCSRTFSRVGECVIGFSPGGWKEMVGYLAVTISVSLHDKMLAAEGGGFLHLWRMTWWNSRIMYVNRLN